LEVTFGLIEIVKYVNLSNGVGRNCKVIEPLMASGQIKAILFQINFAIKEYVRTLEKLC
jgi:hypothetical protein